MQEAMGELAGNLAFGVALAQRADRLLRAWLMIWPRAR